jgi:hypothetical protein
MRTTGYVPREALHLKEVADKLRVNTSTARQLVKAEQGALCIRLGPKKALTTYSIPEWCTFVTCKLKVQCL